MKSPLVILACLILSMACKESPKSDTHYVYIASAGDADSIGIGIYEWNATDATLKAVSYQKEPSAVSYLTVDQTSARLYSVGSTISSFKINQDGALTLLNQIQPNGRGACHVSVSNDRKSLLVAYYTSGSASMYAINEDGTVGELVWSVQHEGSSVNAQRQEAAHAHMILPAPNSSLILVPDLGIDKVMVYASNAEGYVSAAPNPFAEIKAGGGPRHAVFHPNTKYVYVLHELTGHVTGFRFDPEKGITDSINTVPTLPDDFADFNKSADIHITPNGQYLYASNRGHNSLAIFRVDQESGTLTFLGTRDCGGVWPRAFAVDPSGQYLLVANKRSDQISVMKIDYETGFFEKMSEVKMPLEPQGMRFVSKK